MRLEGKSAIITGAGRGIGKEMALRFSAEGAAVVVTDIVGDLAVDVAAEITKRGGRAHAVTADVSDQTQVEALFDEANNFLDGRLDVLVNNAGIAHHAAFLELDVKDWQHVLNTNLTSVFLCTQQAGRIMVQYGGGSIINIGSISGQRGSTGRIAYGTAKAGIHQLTRILGVELGPMGIRVNAIAPGPIDTGMTKMGPDQRKRYLERLPIGRFGAAGDIAAIAVFLATEDASFMTGSIVNADGGFDAAGLIFDYDELVNVKSDGRDPDFKP